MICPKYADMRARFAASGASLAADGFPAWPGPLQSDGSYGSTATYLRGGGFASSWTVATAGGAIYTPAVVGPIGPLLAGLLAGGDPLFPLTITCNAGAADAGVGQDAFCWYLSQGSDGLRYVLANGTLSPTGQPQYFTLTHPSDELHSGTVILGTQSAQISALFPGSGGVPPTDPASLATLFAKCALYVSRLSDSSYQWATFVAP